MWYTVTKTGNTFIFTPNYPIEDFGKDIRVTLYTKSCSEKDIISVKEIGSPKSIIFELPAHIDETYYFEVTNVPTGQVSVYVYEQYNNFLLLLLEQMEQYLCPDKCCGCCDEVRENGLLTRILSFYILNRKKYSLLFDRVFSCAECSIREIEQCILYNSNMTGEVDNKDLEYRFIAYFYLLFYLTEALSLPETKDLDVMFSYGETLKCIRKRGINTDCVLQGTDKLPRINIDFNGYVNLPPSQVGDNTLTTGNRQNIVFDMSVFTTSTVPVYQDPENDPANAIRVDTLPSQGVLSVGGIPVVQGQVVTKDDIDNGLFVYEPPSQDDPGTTYFLFSVRDSGSNQFSQ